MMVKVPYLERPTMAAIERAMSRQRETATQIAPYYQDKLITIYNADSRDVLPQLKLRSVDMILTDPPYGVKYVPKSGVNAGERIIGDDSLNSLRDVMPALEQLLRHNRHAYFFSSSTKIGETVEIIAHWWRVKNVIVWDKGNSGGQGDLLAGYSPNWEGIIYANKGRRPLIGPRPRSIYRYDWGAAQVRKEPLHPTVKPVGLMSQIIAKSTERGELILDPFCGSGPVLRAARDLGRRAIGIELDERYCAAAVSRLKKAI
jgi:DNA modification methylase